MTTDLPLATANVQQEVRSRVGTEGLAALPPTTIFSRFNDTVQKYGDKPALNQKRVKQVWK
jgi:hypothetical protein